MVFLKQKALSPIIGYIFTVVIAITAISLGVYFINPLLTKIKESSVVNEAWLNLETLDSAIRDVASQGEGASTKLTLKVTDGKYELTPSGSLIFEYKITSGIIQPGSYQEKGAVTLVAGFNLTTEENDESYIIDNGIVEAEFRKIEEMKKPLVWLHFDEGSGTVAYDYSGNNNHATLYNTNWSPGKFNYSVVLDGSTSFITVSEQTAIEPDELTVEAWIYPESFKEYMAIADKAPNSGYIVSGWRFDIDDVTPGEYLLRVKLCTYEEGCEVAYGTTVLQSNEWYHVAFTYNGTHIAIYLNGNLENAVEHSGKIDYTSVKSLHIGTEVDAPSFVFDGRIDEFRLYSRALSANEIKAHYYGGLKRLKLKPLNKEVSVNLASLQELFQTTIQKSYVKNYRTYAEVIYTMFDGNKNSSLIFILPNSADYLLVKGVNITLPTNFTYQIKIGENVNQNIIEIGSVEEQYYGEKTVTLNNNYPNPTQISTILPEKFGYLYYEKNNHEFEVEEFDDYGLGNISARWLSNYSTFVEYTLPGKDGFGHGVRDCTNNQLASCFLYENGSKCAEFCLQNDFVKFYTDNWEEFKIESTQDEHYNWYFNLSYHFTIDAVPFSTAYGENFQVYFYDWDSNEWKLWKIGVNVPNWTDVRNKEIFEWKFVYSNVGYPEVNLTYIMTAHEPFIRIIGSVSEPGHIVNLAFEEYPPKEKKFVWNLTAVPRMYYWYYNYLKYRKPIIITENSGNDLEEYQVPINVTYNSHMNSDFSDLRFTYYNEIESTEEEIPYWIEEKIDGSWAYVWIKVPYIPANGNATLYMYYGNTTPVTSESDGEEVFILFDHFDGTQLDSNKWTTVVVGTGKHKVDNSILTITDAEALSKRYKVYSTSRFSVNKRLIARLKSDPQEQGRNFIFGFDETQNTAALYSGSTVLLRIYYYWGGGYKAWRYYVYDSSTGLGTNAILEDDTVDWSKVEIRWVLDHVSFYRNGTLLQEFTDPDRIPENDLYVVMGITSWDTAYNLGSGYWDYVAVANYMEPKPTYSIGEEEEKPNWWNDNWKKRMQMNLTEVSNGNYEGYPPIVNISYQEGMQTDFRDIRIINSTGGIVDYAIIDMSEGEWVEIVLEPMNWTAGETKEFYIYFDNPSADWANVSKTTLRGWVDDWYYNHGNITGPCAYTDSVCSHYPHVRTLNVPSWAEEAYLVEGRIYGIYCSWRAYYGRVKINENPVSWATTDVCNGKSSYARDRWKARGYVVQSASQSLWNFGGNNMIKFGHYQASKPCACPVYIPKNPEVSFGGLEENNVKNQTTTFSTSMGVIFYSSEPPNFFSTKNSASIQFSLSGNSVVNYTINSTKEDSFLISLGIRAIHYDPRIFLLKQELNKISYSDLLSSTYTLCIPDNWTKTKIVNEVNHTVKYSCNFLINSTIEISSSSTSSVSGYSIYNFTDSTNNKAYYDFSYDSDLLSPDEVESSATPAASSDYPKLEDSDDVRWETSGDEYEFQYYKFKINEDISQIDNITVKWEGYSEKVDPTELSLYIWNDNTQAWEEIDSGVYDTDFILQHTFTTGIGNYIDEEGYLWLGVRGDAVATCPMVYTYNGSRYVFVGDSSIDGGLGFNGLTTPYQPSDPIDYVTITSKQLKPVNGLMNIVIGEDLKEITYLDSVQLIKVYHKKGTKVLSTKGIYVVDPEKHRTDYVVVSEILPIKSFKTEDGISTWSRYVSMVIVPIVYPPS